MHHPKDYVNCCCWQDINHVQRKGNWGMDHVVSYLDSPHLSRFTTVPQLDGQKEVSHVSSHIAVWEQKSDRLFPWWFTQNVPFLDMIYAKCSISRHIFVIQTCAIIYWNLCFSNQTHIVNSVIFLRIDNSHFYVTNYVCIGMHFDCEPHSSIQEIQ